MAVHWNDATLGDFHIWYGGEDHADIRDAEGGIVGRIRDPGYFPRPDDSIEVRVDYRGHAFQWKDGRLIGIRNGSPEFLPPTEIEVLDVYFKEFRPVVEALVELCENEDKYRGKPLPVGLVPTLRQGIDIEEYEHDIHCSFEHASARRDAKFALPDEGFFR